MGIGPSTEHWQTAIPSHMLLLTSYGPYTLGQHVCRVSKSPHLPWGKDGGGAANYTLPEEPENQHEGVPM